MSMTQIDMKRIREALPCRAQVKLGKKNSTPFIECLVRWPGLYDKGTKEEQATLEQVLQWQRDIIGEENITEFYTEETGSHWIIWLKRKPYEFLNTIGDDINSFTGVDIMKDGKINTSL